MAIQEGEKRAQSAIKATERKAFVAKFHAVAMKMYRGERLNDEA